MGSENRWEELWDAACPDWRRDPPAVFKLESEPCSYRPGYWWSLRMITHSQVDRLMLLGGQRFGFAYCVTACPGCRACVPARIRVQGVKLTKSQRRTLRRNDDLRLVLEPVTYTDQKFQLLKRFVEKKFGSQSFVLECEQDRVQYYLNFHLHHPDHSREVQYWHEGELLGVSIVDLGRSGIYSHYFFYDLEVPRRRLGIYSFLREILWCQQMGYPYLYIGFLNLESPALKYKAQFQQLEVLQPQVGWVSYPEKG